MTGLGLMNEQFDFITQLFFFNAIDHGSELQVYIFITTISFSKQKKCI